MSRKALLIRCSKDEAERIRVEANKENHTLSRYVLTILTRAVAKEDRLFAQPQDHATNVLSRRAIVEPGQRTAMLIRCSVAEAEGIRQAAQRRHVSINAFVIQSMKRVWTLQGRQRVDEPVASSAFDEMLQ